jgi:hypothetical protein
VYVLTEFEQVGGNERASGRFPSKGFEVQVYNGTAGPRTGSLYHVVDLGDPLVKDEEWFTQTIIVKGDSIVVKINEKPVVSWTQPADWTGGPEGPGRRITGPGTIALQAHDAKSAVLYKNIRIRPLERFTRASHPCSVSQSSLRSTSRSQQHPRPAEASARGPLIDVAENAERAVAVTLQSIPERHRKRGVSN